ncbi:MAG: helix-turn-helix domain-containing protein [Alphaproteobacteria bacterium]|nr:helix-turn-helix domain-containing protein [Alphaproteobacteria bacterium]
MHQIAHIRKFIFGLTQIEFSVVAGVSQGTVSRWETGELLPSLEEMSRIRAEAKVRSLAWDDSWFFELPSPQNLSPAPTEV